MMFLFWFSAVFSQPRLSYEEELEDRMLASIAPFVLEGNDRMVNKHVQAFEKDLFPSARIHYEIALQYNTNNQLSEALKHYNRALEIDPAYQQALYDRAELLIVNQQPDAALTDLQSLVETGVEHWAVYFRLAEIFADKKEGVLFEQNLLLAIRHGFSLHLLLQSGDKWKGYAKDPELSDHLHTIIQLYGEEQIWDLLQQ